MQSETLFFFADLLPISCEPSEACLAGDMAALAGRVFQVPGVYSLSGRIIHGWLNSGSPSGEGATTWGFGSDTGVPSPTPERTSASETSAYQPSQPTGAS